MAKVTLIFVGGNSLVDKAIDAVSHGIYSHVAIQILGSTLESLGLKDDDDKYPGVWLHAENKYTNNPDAKFVDVELPNLAGALQEARKLISTPYGYTDCIRGGLHDLVGINLPGNKITANCSETVARILRAGGLDLLPDTPADCITPNYLYWALEVDDGRPTVKVS